MRAPLLTIPTICLALALAACGDDEQTAKAPALPPGLSQELASQSEQVAGTLEAGDPCAAQAQAAVLQASVNSAIAAGGVPDQLKAEVRAGADRISSGIVCEPASPPTATEETTTTPTVPDCDTLQQQLDQLDEHDKSLDDQRKALEEQLKDFCEDHGHGEEGGPGNSGNAPGHNKD